MDYTTSPLPATEIEINKQQHNNVQKPLVVLITNL